MNKALSVCLTVILLLTLSACDIADTPEATSVLSGPPATDVTESPAETATEPTTCGHVWFIATCTAPKTCKDCGITVGDANGHSWEEATCSKPKTCSVCSKSEGQANGHTWADATCVTPKTCSICGQTEGKAKGHTWRSATYDDPKTCSTCGQTEGSPLEKPENYHGHVYTGGSSSKKYHYEPECAGKNSHEITWEEVTERGLEPCGTCVLQ